MEPDKQVVEVKAGFNSTFYNTLKSFGLHHGTAYYQYCPMANGDIGAYWFSDEKDIENPYFGDEILKCGETERFEVAGNCGMCEARIEKAANSVEGVSSAKSGIHKIHQTIAKSEHVP